MGLLKSVAANVVGHWGYSLVPRRDVERLEFSRLLRTLFDRAGVDTVLDVGANTGQYHDFLRNEVGFRGTIHSFEPLESLCKRMADRQSSDQKWVIHNVALGAAESTTEINVMHETQFSSIRSPRLSGLHNFDSNNAVVYRQPVRVRRLDDLVAETPLLQSASKVYLKIDTQGYDLEVLKGASKTLLDVVALQTEASILPIYEGMPDYRASIDTSNALGFDICAMFPIVRDQYMRLVEFDCVMVNRKQFGVVDI